jgi:hypothetical protein
LRLRVEVACAAREQSRSERGQKIVDALRVVLDAVEAVEDARQEHEPQPYGGVGVRARDGPEAFFQSLDDAIHVREDDLLFAREVQVDGAFADADLAGDVLDRHLAVAVAGQQPVGRVENRLAHFLSHRRRHHRTSPPDS